MTLSRWNPMRDMMRLRNEFDRLYDDTIDFPSWRWPEPAEGPAVDVVESDDAYIVKASLPGIKPDDLDVSITDNVLTIKGEVKNEETISEEQYHLRERRYGAFTRMITLPTSVDVDSVEATYEDGILTLNAPKTEDVKRKRITVTPVESTKMLEGSLDGK
jgi:HSP20 family protein